jgi:anti-sigma regulatory factor (Ser/Thr protein kinase)
MVRARQAEARERERIEQEMLTAQQIQRTFLPKDVPAIAGWQLVPYYQPAREVGGDFYDFFQVADGRIGLVIGDVTGKGMPAALVMTAARTMLRTAAQQDAAPGSVFARVNELLYADIPSGMFVTSFYVLLDPATGQLTYANAGQDYPCLRHADGTVGELRATGMPLGLMPEISYDEYETTLPVGDGLLLFSDGLVEAHDAAREMFGLTRVTQLVVRHARGDELIDAAVEALRVFAGAGWEQEDDITLVSLVRTAADATESQEDRSTASMEVPLQDSAGSLIWRELDSFTVASAPGNEREAIARTAQAAYALGLTQDRVERVRTAVGEATMNAMEHANHFDSALVVTVTVRASAEWLSVLITDHGDTPVPPIAEAPAPDLSAKLAGTQSPRGWGLFLIKNLVDEVRVSNEADSHTIELLMRLPGQGGGAGRDDQR